MKKAITVILLFVCTISIQAQSNNIDKKLLKKYSKKELSALKANNPTEYEFAKYCVDNAFYIGETSKEKVATSPDEYGKIKIKDLIDINFFELNIDLKQRDYQIFVIKGTSKILVVKPKDYILKELSTK